MKVELPKDFELLSDQAVVRMVPIEGGMDATTAAPALAVLQELIGQWKVSGVISSGSVGLIENGYFLLVAWELSGGDLSGCTKDGLTHALLALEKSMNRRMLSAPRLAVANETRQAVRFLDQPTFKSERREGSICEETTVYDHLVTTLGDVRAGRFATTVGASWYNRIKP